MRAELDALVTRYEAQARQLVAMTDTQRRQELDALEQQVSAFAARLQESEGRATALQARVTEREAELVRVRTLNEAAAKEIATLQAELDGALAEVERLTAALGDASAHARSLDEQFVAERRFVEALMAVGTSPLFDATQLALGQSIDATPNCYGALKARKLDVVLSVAVRDRGRSVVRHPLATDERASLGVMAEAAGCELIDVPRGQRFASASMDKVGARPEPADEDHVLECLMPGLRLVGTQGAVVHPRVIVATA